MANQDNKHSYPKTQRVTLIICAAIMAAYILLVYLAAYGSFWDFAAVHTVLMAITVPFIWITNASKVITYIVTSFSIVGAATALGLMLYYLTILNNLMN